MLVPAERLAPRPPSSSEIWIAVRVSVPSVNMAAVKEARPGSRPGSRAAPASSRTRWTATMGSRWDSTRRTARPFASLKWREDGRRSSGWGPSAGTETGGAATTGAGAGLGADSGSFGDVAQPASRMARTAAMFRARISGPPGRERPGGRP